MPATLHGQDRSVDESAFRGNRAEISVTIKDNSGQVIGVPATVKIYHMGALAGQAAASKGRAFFMLTTLGDYTISVEANGYKSAQKEVSLSMAINDEEEIYLQRDSGSSELAGGSGGPVLAPKAKEAYDKGVQSLNEDKLDQAEKHLDEAAKLAPNHPDILYMQGVLYLRQKHFEKAQGALERATQIDPKNAHAFSALGMAFVDEGKYDLAIPPLQQSLQLDSVSWETHWTLASALYRQEQYDGALKESQMALSQSHGVQPAVELLLAQTQTAVGKFEDSAETLRAFIKNHPNDKGVATARKWLDRMAADGKIRKQ
ncbi:MAG TPA: tetratricopeptide repeat protein [Candidatus Dormibacteraeota bacterium]|nr:tetratricopeptide repeat protein [Candidatus Dormibacteraeota bacterium]